MMYLAYALMTLHMFVGIFLIGLILLQRGRGGGLAGAFGGMGGQSAFGTKAGDIFTRITIGVAVFWIVLACVCILVVNSAVKNRAGFLNNKPVIVAPPNDKPDASDSKLGEEADDKKSAGLGALKEGNAAKADPATGKKPADLSGVPAAPAKPDAPEVRKSKPATEGEQDKPESSTPPKSE